MRWDLIILTDMSYHIFQIGEYTISYEHGIVNKEDPTSMTSVIIEGYGSYQLFWDSATVKLDGFDEEVVGVKELDGILAWQGLPTHTEIMDKVNEIEDKGDEDPMGSPSRYESSAQEVVDRLLEDDLINEKKLTTDKRNRLKSSTFALSSERKYPIDTIARARNALARVSQHGTPDEKKRVRAAVYRKYPSIKDNNLLSTVLGW